MFGPLPRQLPICFLGRLLAGWRPVRLVAPTCRSSVSTPVVLKGLVCGLVRFVVAASLVGGPSRVRAAAPVDFSRDVLPILSEYCFQCHGPDEKARKAKLRLDTQEGAFGKNAEGVAIITPGEGAQSELIRRIETTDPDDVMPPGKSKHPLKPEQIGVLKRWVNEGARWGRHWAFEKPRAPTKPRVKNTRWPRNEIDFHVLARLERESLKPSREAARETLIRRLCLDLTGLP